MYLAHRIENTFGPYEFYNNVQYLLLVLHFAPTVCTTDHKTQRAILINITRCRVHET